MELHTRNIGLGLKESLDSFDGKNVVLLVNSIFIYYFPNFKSVWAVVDTLSKEGEL